MSVHIILLRVIPILMTRSESHTLLYCFDTLCTMNLCCASRISIKTSRQLFCFYYSFGGWCDCWLLCILGHIEHGGPSSRGNIPGLRHRGAAANFLQNRGFGWLMEVADDDEEDQQPLLYDLIESSFRYYIEFIVMLAMPALPIAHTDCCRPWPQYVGKWRPSVYDIWILSFYVLS